eukprot:GHVU01113635.1.p1 GENE.GHVU01113635.1~~GHVU01113635.1.p1  ORF type:complete len:199 (+),score=24.70 GHVU01113635.1:2283-2879(+)
MMTHMMTYVNCVFTIHKDHGLVMLKAHKEKKGLHFQVPGGHVSVGELAAHSLEDACKIACARELFEETGIDMRGALDRLISLRKFGTDTATRHFFLLSINDHDSIMMNHPDWNPAASDGRDPAPPETGENFFIRLSSEHVGYMFSRDSRLAAEELKLHSGGKVSEAFARYAAASGCLSEGVDPAGNEASSNCCCFNWC